MNFKDVFVALFYFTIVPFGAALGLGAGVLVVIGLARFFISGVTL